MKNLISALALAIGAATPAAAVSVYSSAASFTAALPGGATTEVEDFSGPNIGTTPVLNFAGITSTYTNGGSFNRHRIFMGEFDVSIDGDAPTTLSWSLPGTVIGVGFDIVGANSADFDALIISASDTSGTVATELFPFLGGTGSGNIDGYFAVLGDSPLGSLSFTSTGGAGIGGTEIFQLDNITLVSVAPIPLPATGLMLLGALGGIGALSRRRAPRS